MKEIKDMKAIFIGEDGSMGFKNGQTYRIRTECRENMIYVLEIHGLFCPYSNIEAFLRNWRLADYIPKKSDDLISRKALLKSIENDLALAVNADVFIQVVKDQPCAFNKKKVIKALKVKRKRAHNGRMESIANDLRMAFSSEEEAYENAIKIIKDEGIDE